MKTQFNNSPLMVFLMMLCVVLGACYASVKYGQGIGYTDGYREGHDKGYSNALKDYDYAIHH